jgi:hypothetical protein
MARGFPAIIFGTIETEEASLSPAISAFSWLLGAAPFFVTAGTRQVALNLPQFDHRLFGQYNKMTESFSITHCHQHSGNSATPGFNRALFS